MTKLETSMNRRVKGFTLIELLVVITILAVLAVIGVAAYRGFTTKGNDGRRQADLEAIGNALEANKTAAGYQVLSTSQFASGSLPTDPISTRSYCVSSVITAGPTIGNKPAAWTAASCPAAAAGVGINGAAFATLSTSAPAANTTAWMICATLEDGTTVVCRNSAQ